MVNILIFGTGITADRFIPMHIVDGLNVLAYIDNNSEKHGRMKNGRQIYSPEKINNFESAIKAFEKVISIDKNSGVGYSNLAQVWLTKDVNKAATTIQKAKELDNSNFISKQAKAILTYQSFIRNNKPYEGCLQLIKSETIYDDNIKKAMIEKLIEKYPNIKNQARSELETIKSRFK